MPKNKISNKKKDEILKKFLNDIVKLLSNSKINDKEKNDCNINNKEKAQI